MLHRKLVFLLLLFCCPHHSYGQKPFAEGVIIYKVSMNLDGLDFKPGTYTIAIKGDEIRKEMKVNGLDYIIIMDCSANKAFSLHNRNGKKYAIELKMEDMVKEQEKFLGFTVLSETNESKKMAGLAASTANVVYKDNTSAAVTYSKAWKPAQAVTYERFPGANFLPLDFSYTDESGFSMKFEATKVEAGPVENAMFRIPPDYKMISHAEYVEMNK